jgi:hypothetical protein
MGTPSRAPPTARDYVSRPRVGLLTNDVCDTETSLCYGDDTRATHARSESIDRQAHFLLFNNDHSQRSCVASCACVATPARRDNTHSVYTRSLLLLLTSLAWLLFFSSSFLSDAHAQISVVGSSTSTSATTASARKLFFDSGSNTHWAFWYTGSQIEYAASSDATTWTSIGTLPYNTPNFSVAFKIIGGTSYVFFVSEANTYDIVMRRGTISGTLPSTLTINSFTTEVTVLDGTSSSDKYVMPVVSLDTNDKVWTAAFKDLGDVGERYLVTARRTTNDGTATLTFDAASSMGRPCSASVAGLALVPTTGSKMLLTASGILGVYGYTNVLAYEYNGTAWSEVNNGGVYGTSQFAQQGANNEVRAVVVDSSGNLYIGGLFSHIGSTEVLGLAKWNGTSWSSMGWSPVTIGGAFQVYALALSYTCSPATDRNHSALPVDRVPGHSKPR